MKRNENTARRQQLEKARESAPRERVTIRGVTYIGPVIRLAPEQCEFIEFGSANLVKKASTVVVQCEICGTETISRRDQCPKKRFCGRKCRAVARYRKQKAEGKR